MRFILTAIVSLLLFVGCDAQPIVENERVDTVNKLLNSTQVHDYVIKYEDEAGITNAVDGIDTLIDSGEDDYIPDIGERTSERVETNHEYIKQDNVHYIEVNVNYVVTFTHRRFNGIAHVVVHRPITYDIGTVWIELSVDYNEEGYLLEGRNIITEGEFIDNRNRTNKINN